MKNTVIANITTIIGISICLLIAGFNMWTSLLILGGTVIGCAYLTNENKEGGSNMCVNWILKIYCNLIRTGEAENDWGEYFKFQEMVLKQIRGI